MLRMWAALAALSLSACASPNSGLETAARDCFRTSDVRGYGVVDEHSVRLRVGAQRAYILTIREDTRRFDPTEPIAVQSSSGYVCVGEIGGVRIVGNDPLFPAYVTSIERPSHGAEDEGS